MTDITQLPTNKIWSLGIIGALTLVVLISLGSVFETLDSKEVMVIQYPNGTLQTYVEPGWYGQWFGSVTKYPLRSQFSFSSAADQGSSKDESITIRFNDGGHANISGVVSWEIPTDKLQLISIHRKFGSTQAIEQQLIRTAIESATFTTGPLMSSTESAAEKRNDLQQFLQDQAKNGPYKTRVISIKAIDPLSGQEKTVNAAEIVLDSVGKPIRENASNVNEFGITLLPMTLNKVKYEDAIEQQIAKRQQSIQAVQQAQANALKAEQDAITVAKQGEAEAATTKWKQEAIKAQKVTEAQQELEVATLNAKRDLDVATLAAQQASQYKNQQILIGQGDAEKQRLVMAANGALDAKLEAYVKIQQAYATAISDYKGNWVPQIITGGGNTGAGSGATQMLETLQLKALKDLGLDMTIDRKTTN
jgi:regulator of protease activity HflC (stomatin/prohibitin superfamily)